MIVLIGVLQEHYRLSIRKIVVMLMDLFRPTYWRRSMSSSRFR